MLLGHIAFGACVPASMHASHFFLFMHPTSNKVAEAYWFWPVRLSVRLSVTLALGQEPLEVGS